MNPFEIIKPFITKGATPKGIALNIIKNNPRTNNNPIFNNLVDMAEKGNDQGVEKFVRNVLKGKGIDYDKEVEDMKKVLNIQ